MTGQEIPAPPATLSQPDEYVWGDAIASRDERLARHVTNAFRERYGKAQEAHYVADAAKIAGVENEYAGRLGQGWQRMTLGSTFGPGEHGFGFANGDAAVIVAWLDPQPNGKVPVTIFIFGEKARR